MQNFMELDMKIFIGSQHCDIWGQSFWQKIYQAVSPEPLLQSSQTVPHFLQNPKMNPIKCDISKNSLNFASGA